MEKTLPDLFSKIEETQSFAWLSSNQVVIQDTFYLARNSQNRENAITLSLTNGFFCLTDPKNSNSINRSFEICQICFDLKFELVRENQRFVTEGTQQKRILGNPYCLKFQRMGYKPLCLYSEKIDILIKWKDQLQKIINRKGFHDLFRPIKKIGKGNFASVYLAERLEDNKLVAVKAFSKEATFSQQKGKQALLNQINILRKFHQQNVLKLYAVFQSDNSIYMTMELLEGGQLFSKIQSKHKFTNDQTKQVMSGLLKGLQHMHARRVMHRDLKPENIMIRHKEECDVVIVDFGLATWADQENYLFVRCGTPGYVAPQIINIRDMSTKSDPICDVFSAGLIFHILLMGRPIFPGRTYNEVLNQNRACDFNLNHRDYTQISSQAHNLLCRMLDKNPLTRISASDALNHSYFNRGMQVQQPVNPFQMCQIPKINSKQQDEKKPRLLNKVSICSGQSYRKALKPSNIQNQPRPTYSSIHKNRQSSRLKQNNFYS